MSDVATPATGLGGRRLSASQRSLWSSQLRYRDSPLQNMALLTHIDGPVDAERLVRAFSAVVAKSATLRLTLAPNESDSDGVQVRTDPPASTEIIDVDRREAEWWARDRVATPIDTERSVYDSVLLRHGDGTVSWYLALHHVATDATSSALVYEATVAAYHDAPIELADVDGRAEPRPSKRRDRAVRFWSEREAAPLIDSLYQPVQSRTPETHRSAVELASLHDVQTALAGPYAMISEDLSWSAFLMTALAEYLHRTSGADQFAIGLPIHHRSTPDSQRAVGPLMEVYPVDIVIEPGATHASLHRSISKTMLKVIGNALPGIGAGAADISGIVNVIPRGGLGPFGPLATSTNWIHPGAADPYHLAGLQLTTYASGEPAMSLDLNAAGAGERHRRFATSHVRSIIEAMVADPDESVGSCSLATIEEVHDLRGWGGGQPLPADRFVFDASRPRSSGSVLERLSVALRNSNRPAVVDGDRVLNGQDVWREASRVASSLIDAEVRPGERVGVEFVRSADAVIAILGVLLAGASYVPLDPTHPEARRVRIGERAGVVGVLTDLDGLGDPTGELRSVPVLDPSDEAYVLFTSGSTGEPKGVPITHGGLAAYLAFAAEHYLGPKQRRPVAPLFTSLGFDLTVTTLFLPLIAGGTLVVIPEDGVPGLQEVARSPDLTWIKATPSHLELLKRLLPSSHRITTMVVGGEAFPSRLAAELAAEHPGLDIFNEYGPTEAVVGCMIHQWRVADPGVDVPIGRPVPGVSLRVVDEALNDTPIGVPGQLLIASPGLSPGYLGRDDDGPFLMLDDERWYASGDVVRLFDAERGGLNAVYLGRADDQIKLNGVRLEPGEVIAAIEDHPSVGRAVVRLWQPNEEARPLLAAWVECEKGVEVAELRRHLLTRLAAHQLPSAFALVSELPFNRNGKLEAAALPEPIRVTAEATPIADSPLAAAVMSSWRRVLGLPSDHQLGGADDFFVLGGDSLAALESSAELTETLGIDIPDGVVFTATTLADLLAVIEDIDPDTEADSGPQPSGSACPEPSPGEAALLFEHRLDPASSRYNIGRRYDLGRPVDAERLRRAVETVVGRHQPLHCTHGPRRRVLSPREALRFSIPQLDDEATMSPEVSDAAARALLEAPFDLHDGPLLRVAVHRLDDGTDAVVIVMHHISGDAASLDLLWNEIDGAYHGADLPDLVVSYGDHAAWQKNRGRADAAVWAAMWETPVETDLGLHRPLQPAADGYIERPATFSTSALRAGPGRTPAATAIGALAALLDRHHGSVDDERPGRYAIGLAASVRDHRSTEPLIGYFLNTLPLVVEVPSGDLDVGRLSVEAGSVLSNALPHRTYPYAEIVAGARRDGRQVPAPGVLLAVQDHPIPHFGGAPVETSLLASQRAVVGLSVFVQIRGEEVALGVEFDGATIDAPRAALLLDDLETLMAAALDGTEPVLPSTADSVLEGPPPPDTSPLTATIGEHLRSGGDRPAVTCGSHTLSWDDLDRRSAQLATQLRLNGVGAGDRVVVSLGRSSDLVVGLVALLRLGAVYVPVDPSYPEERRELIISAAEPVAAIVDSGTVVPWVPSISVSADGGGSVTFDDTVVAPDDLAYVIFTSGSTGRPKGVPISHRSLASSTRARDSVFPLAPGRFLLLSSIGFDSSIVGLFWTLAEGGELIVPTEQEAHDPDALLRLIEQHEISHLLMVPTLYRALLERGAGAAHWPAVAIVAGEACSGDLVDRHHEQWPDSLLVNEYGPTEGTVWATAHVCRPGDEPVPIGTPIPGAWCAVVDPIGQVVPANASGELIIGGAGVAGRYLHGADDATNGPFSETSILGDGPAYRTGDAAVSVTGRDGGQTLIFTGRVDDQLNVGGVRLEPGDVERVLVSVDGVDAAIVVSDTGAGSDRAILAAHLEVGAGFDGSSLRGRVASQLPPSMRPSRYVVHQQLPTTVHGKVDRRALGAWQPGEGDLVSSETEPSDGGDDELDSIETEVLALFREHVPTRVGVDDGFFDAGGDSLAALTLVMELEERFETEVSVTALLAAPTARAVAASIRATRSVGDADLRVESPAPIPGDEPRLVEWIRQGRAGGPVLVLCAPGSGHLVGYEPLISALSADVPIVGLRLPGYDGKSEPLVTVEAIADRVEAELWEAVGGRSAVLFGGSSGGLVAWELAGRALAGGGPVRLLVLQDTVHPDWRRAFDSRSTIEVLREVFETDGWRGLAEDLVGRGQRRFKRWRMQRASEAQEAAGGEARPEVVARRMIQAANEKVAAYRPRKLDGVPVVFFAAESTDPDSTHHRWHPIASNFTVEVFPGDHFGENGLASRRNVANIAARAEALLAD